MICRICKLKIAEKQYSGDFTDHLGTGAICIACNNKKEKAKDPNYISVPMPKGESFGDDALKLSICIILSILITVIIIALMKSNYSSNNGISYNDITDNDSNSTTYEYGQPKKNQSLSDYIKEQDPELYNEIDNRLKNLR